MNNLEAQFLGFLETSSLFKKFDGLEQFELKKEELENLDFSSLNIPDKLPLGKKNRAFFYLLYTKFKKL